jgi:hypothetical protein
VVALVLDMTAASAAHLVGAAAGPTIARLVGL